MISYIQYCTYNIVHTYGRLNNAPVNLTDDYDRELGKKRTPLNQATKYSSAKIAEQLRNTGALARKQLHQGVYSAESEISGNPTCSA